MAKKKKGEMETLMGMLEDMLGSFSPEQQLLFMDKMPMARKFNKVIK